MTWKVAWTRIKLQNANARCDHDCHMKCILNENKITNSNVKSRDLSAKKIFFYKNGLK